MTSSQTTQPKHPSPRIQNWDDYVHVSTWARQDPDQFWAAVAEQKVLWRKPWSKVSDCDFKSAKVSWYEGAELNVAENCLDRHLQAGMGDKKALIWVGNEVGEERTLTYQQLFEEVCRVSRALEAYGIQKGDRVVLYLPNIPELAICMLACARIGAVHSVIFGGFSAASIYNRVNNCGARLIITANGTYRGKKWVGLKDTVDEAMKMGCPTIQNVIVYPRHPERQEPAQGYDLDWNTFLRGAQGSVMHTPVAHSAQDSLFILYTSGSTGQPKGVLHRMGGYLAYVAYTAEIVFQFKQEDIFWCTADMGWITGHSYVLYGPLSNGMTTLMYEGVPTYPDASRFWEIVEKYQVTVLYTAPTAIRILASAGNHFVKKHSRHSLRLLGSVGEPINPEAWRWYHKVVGEDRLPIVDTWWQTETGGILISPLAGISPAQPGSASLPLPGVEVHLLDEKAAEIQGPGTGSLVISRSWPGQMTEVYGDPKRFYETYFTQFSGYYSTGDGCMRDSEGLYWITGRMDDVIKVSGHRLGSAEVESACISHHGVAESAAVGVPDSMTGEALHVFVVARGKPPADAEIIQVIRKEVGPLATPKKIHWIVALPKTRSGKIMRRILRKIASGETENLGDLSTLAEPGVVDDIIRAVGPT